MTEDSIISQLHFLLVDDDRNMRILLRRTLVCQGATSVVEAEHGDAAWPVLTMPDGKINFVICDWNTPGISGIDLLRKIKAEKPAIPLLMLTGRADVESISAALTSGIDGYLVKPTTPQEFIAKVRFIVSCAGIVPYTTSEPQAWPQSTQPPHFA